MRIRCLLAIAIFAGSSLLLASDKAPAPQIRAVEKTNQNPFEIEVSQLPIELLEKLAKLEPTDEAFGKVFTVTVSTDAAAGRIPPVSGRYRVEGPRLIFTPKYPPRPGLTYRAEVFGGEDEKTRTTVKQEISIPKPTADANRTVTEALRIYPTADVLPENHLRFYIYFSQPMTRGAAYDYLQLLDAKGKPVEGAFLELGEELWDPARKRFTLLLDPGRIKHGLKPREELGPVLFEGKQYTLVVKRTWQDVEGQSLKADLKKTFVVGRPQDKPLDVKTWKVSQPVPGEISLVSVKFPQPLDHALMERLISVVDDKGQPVPGQVFVCNAERQWNFKPQSAWNPGKYQLVVDTVLEDSAGNRIGQAFEVDQFEPVTQSIVPEYVRIPIEVQDKPAVSTP